MAANVFVTGGTGVIGAWVVRGLVEAGANPIVFVRGQTNAIGHAINWDIEDRLTIAQGDMQDLAAIERALDQHRPDVIVHMASAKPWQIEPPFTPAPDPRQAIDQIVNGTGNILEAARRKGIRRVVYASSKGVYGNIKGPYGPPEFRPLPADHPFAPNMLYGVGKASAELLGRYYADMFGLQFVAIRFSSSFGPLKRGTPMSPDGMIQAAARKEVVRIRQFPTGMREDFAYHKDVAAGFVRAALAPGDPGRAYNIGSGRLVNHEDIATSIRHLVPDAHIEFLPSNVDLPGIEILDGARCLMDIAPAQRDLGYAPQFGVLEDAFQDFLKEDERMAKAPPLD